MKLNSIVKLFVGAILCSMALPMEIADGEKDLELGDEHLTRRTGLRAHRELSKSGSRGGSRRSGRSSPRTYVIPNHQGNVVLDTPPEQRYYYISGSDSDSKSSDSKSSSCSKSSKSSSCSKSSKSSSSGTKSSKSKSSSSGTKSSKSKSSSSGTKSSKSSGTKSSKSSKSRFLRSGNE
eukprot:CAMPEP_0178787276 /NCGR_PEP_ID=MMETSP0745-20121128/5766_1 /TAXON_ID=913974 /ORGANISM="Nitzschia punctata, Strain CCMP561" /LENGTH=177 /DNA_ID=CAMNT_0020445111 /DNA_START=22 /DNA_END=555 /DNA_ORIENTATION=+